MSDEKYIEERVGRRNPYQVPEGYFDAFTSQLMQQLPERPSKARQVRMRRPIYAVQQEVVEESIDEAADYMMLDNHDIYALLSEN